MKDQCEECAMWREKGASFCPACGNPLDERPERPITDYFILLGTTAILFIVLVNTVYIARYFTEICDSLDVLRVSIAISFGLWDVRLGAYDGIWIDLELALITLTEAACAAYAGWRLVTVLRKKPDDYHAQVTTGLCAATWALSVSILVSVVGILLTAMEGQAPNTDWMDDFTDFQMVYLLTRAGVNEELMFRVLFIGVPMAVIALILRRDVRCWQYLFGGFGMNKIAVILIVFSSILFGLAHYDGWGWSKVPLTLFGGILFAYVYTEYGLYASIIMHTANDVMLTLSYAGMSLLTVFAEFSLIALGAIVLIRWMLHPNRELFDFRNMETFPEKLDKNLKEQWERH